MSKVVEIRKFEAEEQIRTQYFLWCPGCNDLHLISDLWEWDRNEESPTFRPSILVVGGTSGITCHSFITNGVWKFLEDSTHKLAGQETPMVPIPSGLID